MELTDLVGKMLPDWAEFEAQLKAIPHYQIKAFRQSFKNRIVSYLKTVDRIESEFEYHVCRVCEGKYLVVSETDGWGYLGIPNGWGYVESNGDWLLCDVCLGLWKERFGVLPKITKELELIA